MADDRFIVIDTETTGLDPARDHVVSIGLVAVAHGELLRAAARHVLVDPGVPIPPSSTAIHGIADADVRAAPRLEQAVEDLRGMWSGACLVGHNLAFDLAFLAPAGMVADQTLDTLAASRLLWPHRGTGHTLDDVAGRVGVIPEHRHTALGDALATAEILCAMLPLLQERGFSDPAAVAAAAQRQDAYRARLRRSIRRRSRSHRGTAARTPQVHRRTRRSRRPRP